MPTRRAAFYLGLFSYPLNFPPQPVNRPAFPLCLFQQNPLFWRVKARDLEVMRKRQMFSPSRTFDLTTNPRIRRKRVVLEASCLHRLRIGFAVAAFPEVQPVADPPAAALVNLPQGFTGPLPVLKREAAGEFEARCGDRGGERETVARDPGGFRQRHIAALLSVGRPDAAKGGSSAKSPLSADRDDALVSARRRGRGHASRRSRRAVVWGGGCRRAKDASAITAARTPGRTRVGTRASKRSRRCSSVPLSSSIRSTIGCSVRGVKRVVIARASASVSCGSTTP
jgi:hypothetical protein